MRHPAGEDLRLVRAVHADEAAARPVRQCLRAGAGSERDRAVERVVEVRELAADVELAAGRVGGVSRDSIWKPCRMRSFSPRLDPDAGWPLRRNRRVRAAALEPGSTCGEVTPSALEKALTRASAADRVVLHLVDLAEERLHVAEELVESAVTRGSRARGRRGNPIRCGR